MSVLTNILTIDLEDWHSLVARKIDGRFLPPSRNVFRQVMLLLDLLESEKCRATFFVVGNLAIHFPELVKSVSSRGHEIASHSHTHTVLNRHTPKTFREDARTSKHVLEDITGKAVLGFRAPEFSITRRTFWALEILAELGFMYDSSIFPIYHWRYGIPNFTRSIEFLALRNGLKIAELPLATFAWGKYNWPIAGGGYFRLLPSSLLYHMARKLNIRSMPMITYFHPYEFDTHSLDSYELHQSRNLKGFVTALYYKLQQNIGRRTMPSKLTGLLKQFTFTSCQEALSNIRRLH